MTDSLRDYYAEMGMNVKLEPKQQDLVTRLRDTASKGVSVWGDLQMEAASEIDALRTRVAELEKDAGRYRVLRSDVYQQHEDDISVSDSSFNVYFGEELDTAVDALSARYAAMAKEQPCKT